MEHSSNQANGTGKTQAHQTQPLAGVTVLLVEDEFDIANLLLFILNEAGVMVESGWGGKKSRIVKMVVQILAV